MVCTRSAIRHSPRGSLRLAGLAAALAVALLACAPLRAADETDFTSAEFRERLHRQLDREIAELTTQIEKSPEALELYSQRGDKLFFRGNFSEAARDFDRMLALDPGQEKSHWRRGIACFYAERYDDAARQFEVYHSFDNVDRENGIWRYLSQFKASGKDQARRGLLQYAKDDREPFPDIYRLFSGEITGAMLLERIERADVAAGEREKRLFYARLYIGLNEYVEGRLEQAETHLAHAVNNAWGARASGGPGWMWHVGRVHYDRLRAARAASPAPPK